jgi:hypothetical protein
MRELGQGELVCMYMAYVSTARVLSLLRRSPKQQNQRLIQSDSIHVSGVFLLLQVPTNQCEDTGYFKTQGEGTISDVW